MNFKQLKDFDFKNIDIDRNQFERKIGRAHV